jgi:hypothetical protein
MIKNFELFTVVINFLNTVVKTSNCSGTLLLCKKNCKKSSLLIENAQSAFHNMTLAQKSAAAIIFDITPVGQITK